MAAIRDFPDDDNLWVIKWVDKFTAPHLATRSPAVSVLLERLTLKSRSNLSRLSKTAVADLLARPKGNPDPGDFRIVRVLSGLLPHLVIGRVFQHKEYIGEIPASHTQITLPLVEESGSQVTVESILPSPPAWNGHYPYKILHASEYYGIQSAFGSSRCFVFADPKDGIEYIIPRAVIFRTFFAPERELALAFTSGAWRTTKNDVVCEKDLDSGLRTHVDESGNWYVILQRRVSVGFAPLVGLFRFNRFAEACADSIYSSALADCNHNPSKPWFASAKIPFSSQSGPIRLNIKGFGLRPRVTRNGGEIVKRAFLVTAITSCEWSRDLSNSVFWEKVGSGAQGANIKEDEGERPYSRYPGSRMADSGIEITNDVDADASSWDQILDEDSFFWMGGPRLEKALKTSSTRYEGGGPSQSEEDEASVASGGVRTYEDGAVAPVASRMVVRDPVNRFLHLIEALNECEQTGQVSTFSILQPEEPSQQIRCGGQVCWNFLSENDRYSGQWPRTGWSMMPRARKGDRRKPRAALVVRLVVGRLEGLWIEIETGRGGQGTRSPFLCGPASDEQAVTSAAINVIATAKGVNLQTALLNAGLLPTGCRIRCYTHFYEKATEPALSAASIQRFLDRCERDQERLGLV